jgi:hypothetical protein
MSYANVMATVAVFIALGTGAYAASKIDSKDISRNAVLSKHIKNGNVKAKDLADDLPAGPRGPQGPQGVPGSDGADATNLFASVSDAGPGSPGSLEASSGVTGFSDPDGPNGFLSPYLVTFNRDVSDCVAHANLGAAVTAANFQFGEIYVYFGSNQVAVFSHNNAGSPQDSSFLLSVLC